MLYASRPGAIRAAVLYAAFASSTGAFVPHNLTGQNFSSFSGTYGMMLFDPAWGALGRVLLFPAALQITQACPAPGTCNCSVAYEPDASMWYFDVAPSLAPSENIALTEMHTSNVGPELLTPDATVYIPARGCRPPLILSYGGSLVNVCTSPAIKRLYSDPDNGNASWCFSPSYAVHMLRLDTLSWVHIDVPGGPPANISNNTELAGYHLGVSVVYDRVLDAVIMAGGFYRTNRDVAKIPHFMATYALDLGSLCNAGSEIIVGALKPSRYMQQSRQWARVLSFDALAWLQVLPQGPEIDIAASESMALGLFASDSVKGRVVQVGRLSDKAMLIRDALKLTQYYYHINNPLSSTASTCTSVAPLASAIATPSAQNRGNSSQTAHSSTRLGPLTRGTRPRRSYQGSVKLCISVEDRPCSGLATLPVERCLQAVTTTGYCTLTSCGGNGCRQMKHIGAFPSYQVRLAPRSSAPHLLACLSSIIHRSSCCSCPTS